MSDNLLAETFCLFVVSQFSSMVMKICICVTAASCRWCWEMMVRSSAYESTGMFGHVGRGMSCMYRLNSVGESTEPCGTPSV